MKKDMFVYVPNDLYIKIRYLSFEKCVTIKKIVSEILLDVIYENKNK